MKWPQTVTLFSPSLATLHSLVSSIWLDSLNTEKNSQAFVTDVEPQAKASCLHLLPSHLKLPTKLLNSLEKRQHTDRKEKTGRWGKKWRGETESEQRERREGERRGEERTHRLHLHYFQVNAPLDSQTTLDHQGTHKLPVRIA